MSTFTCPVVRVASVEDHPNADRLNLVRLDGLGYTCISGKLEDGSPRYKTGDWVVYIPSAAILPEYLLKEMDFWDEVKGKGTLAGSDGNRVKPLRLRGIFSEGVLYPATVNVIDSAEMVPDGYFRRYWQIGLGENTGKLILRILRENTVADIAGHDVSDDLGITKYEPPIPVHMAGEVANLFDHTVKYDFERLESVPDIFEPGEPVVATEKLHGTFCAIVYVPGLNHQEMFGSNGEIIVHSKGLGASGLAFKNNEANDGNLYVKALRKLLSEDLEAKLKEVSRFGGGAPVFIMGEIFGRGVQDLHYGTKEPEFRIFEIRVGHEYLPRDQFGFGHLDSQTRYGGTLGFDAVPVLYHGPFDLAQLELVRDGKTMLAGDNIREGIVVRSATEARHEIHGRKICKMISPDYLTRKSKDATEYT
jgi:RNA ligase (TIGR02306 family)